MDFFGIGAPELVLILLVLFILFGPTRLPEVAAMMGKAVRKLKQASAEMNRNLKDVSDEIQETGKETGKAAGGGDKGLAAELKDVRQELGDAAKDVKDATSIRSTLKKDLQGIAGDITAAARETPAPENKPPETAVSDSKPGETAANSSKESRP
jgi:TatA/E family protein of Tat protein translocase